MNCIDAFMIVDDYVDALANGQKPQEKWKRKSALKNSDQEICNAMKLVFAHSLFWFTIPNDEMKLLERSMGHIGDFIDDKLVDEYNEITRALGNRNPFTKLRDSNERRRLEERETQIQSCISESMMGGFKQKQELGDFIVWLQEKMKTFKNRCASLPDHEYKAQFGDLMGNFVCDIYEAAHIEREYDDTEYYWPVDRLYKFSIDPKYDRLFKKYRSYIYHLYTRYHR